MLRVWGRISSINVRKVVWTLQELELAVQRTDAGGQFGLVREADYLARNPNGLVPLLEDGEVLLWESNVIVRYLCARYAPGRLYPEGLAARFDAERWMDWQQTSLNPAGRGAFFQLIRTAPELRDESVVAASVASMEPLLDLLDRHLAGRAYLSGDSFSMADIPVACDVHRWGALPFASSAVAGRPNLDRWFRGLAERAGAKGVLDAQLV
ncbi:glutathione S-transferase [Xylophilus sp. GOD-11R]|uniref:glutathione S-transferase family protein n=1 Tax=Xylophilus sp. GOD-11R TaxID=3089814 RepID=UPI00298C5C0F|nr:glutathione S-transferase [Xylophilus sp. GOD-11R]WPB56436.1 glutathione S-transferase [Xylophilus sp. GOD-11R]